MGQSEARVLAWVVLGLEKGGLSVTLTSVKDRLFFSGICSCPRENRGYLIRFGHTESGLRDSMDLKILKRNIILD